MGSTPNSRSWRALFSYPSRCLASRNAVQNVEKLGRARLWPQRHLKISLLDNHIYWLGCFRWNARSTCRSAKC